MNQKTTEKLGIQLVYARSFSTTMQSIMDVKNHFSYSGIMLGCSIVLIMLILMLA